MIDHNPYSNSGKIIYGNRFIGRERSLRLIDARLISSRAPGNLAIVGEPRIGKSSLAWHGIMSRRQELMGRRSMVIWLDVGLFQIGWQIFTRLVLKVKEILFERQWLTPSMDRLSTSIIQADDLTEQSQSDVISFF